ncbi:hypothetical protein BJ878DRAFT_465963 [Calycina marina]|uniref:Allergen n=1 Tax=Calycina marina TaxID=1763456 RepID=A0A9P8CDU0_9HELO|nr:hypothetical protein BJ878DRAFT_465963 [Calycina marina]
MDNAMNAIKKTFATADPATSEPEVKRVKTSETTDEAVAAEEPVMNANADKTVEAEVAPAVENVHVRKEHETRQKTFVEKEVHKDHYHTTVQPLKDVEVQAEKHDYDQETKYKEVDNSGREAKAKAEADRAGFESTKDEKRFESRAVEDTETEAHVHHHLHETIQPVIEKEVIVPSVTHKRIDVKEKIQEPSEHHGVTTKQAISVDEFKNRLDGEKSSKKSVD